MFDQLNRRDFEQLVSFRPTFNKLGDQPTIRDFIFDYYCKLYVNNDEMANASTKRALNELFEVFGNQRCKFVLE